MIAYPAPSLYNEYIHNVIATKTLCIRPDYFCISIYHKGGEHGRFE